MNKHSKYALGFAGIVLAGTLTVGMASAAGNGDGEGNGRWHHPQLTDEQKCEYRDRIEARVDDAQVRIEERLATLADNKAEAEAQGNDVVAARIERRIERLTKIQQRIADRYAQYEEWADANCSTADVPVDTTA